MTSPSPSELTHDTLLGGRVRIWQPAKGFRAGIDSVMLAASVEARAGERVLELGCGPGAVLLCLAARVPGLRLSAVELQESYAALARRNAAEAGIAAEIVTGDAIDLPKMLRGQYEHVVANPPYFDRARGAASDDPGRETAFGASALDGWIATARARLAPKGWLTLIQRIERLPEVLDALGPLGSVTMLPLAGRDGRAPERFLLRARKDGRRAFRLLPPLALHEGQAHRADAPDYTPAVMAVSRDGAALPWERG